MVIQRFLLAVCLSWANLLFAQPVSAPPTVAVWDFENHTVSALTTLTQLDFLKRTLSEVILASLLGATGIKVVDRLHLQEVLTEQKLGSSDLADTDTRIRLGRIMGAQRMIFGSFTAIGDQVQVSLRAVDSATSLIIFADQYTCGIDQVLNQAQETTRRLTRALGSSILKPVKDHPTPLWAEYDKALALSDAGRYPEAIEALKNILIKDKDFVIAERQLTAVLERLARQ